MTYVDTAIDELIKKEGGYVNHPNDRGGPTTWGITEQVARAYGYTGSMQSLPRAKAVEIYKQRYWMEPKFYEVAKRAMKLANELFDTGVNMGTGIASRFFQRALNAFNKRAKAYPDLTVDGRIGTMSLYALDQLIKSRGAKDAETVMVRLADALQAVRYLEIVEANQTQEDFMFGWIFNRVGGE